MLIMACILIVALLLCALGVALLGASPVLRTTGAATTPALAQQRQSRNLHTSVELQDNWVLTNIEVFDRNFIARVTLKRGSNQTVFARVDTGKAWPIDPVPPGVDKSNLGVRVALIVGPLRK